MLQHGGEALEPHAGVDRGLRQRVHRARLVAVELHEHEVPDLDVAVALGVGRTGRTALDAGPVVVEDLRARPAGTGVAHLPEVVALEFARAGLVADADAALGRHADVLRPELEGLVVGGVDRDPELLLRQPVVDGEQLPGEADGVPLEVVAEAAVAEHLEERVVARRVAHVLEVVVLAARAHAALRGHRPVVWALLQAEEHVLELVHAGVGEQQRRVVAGHERARGQRGVALGGEVVDELLANLFGLHGLAIGRTRRHGPRGQTVRIAKTRFSAALRRRPYGRMNAENSAEGIWRSR